MPQGKAIFAYKKPKQEGHFLIMRVSEAPNGKVSVTISDTSQASPQENHLQVLVPMIEGQQDFNNIDGWLASHELVKKYK